MDTLDYLAIFVHRVREEVVSAGVEMTLTPEATAGLAKLAQCFIGLRPRSHRRAMHKRNSPHAAKSSEREYPQVRGVRLIMITIIKLTILMLLTHTTPAPVPSNAGTELCCHTHDDGSEGCWPAAASSETCENGLQCPNGAYQTNLDDEESWVCASGRVS